MAGQATSHHSETGFLGLLRQAKDPTWDSSEWYRRAHVRSKQAVERAMVEPTGLIRLWGPSLITPGVDFTKILSAVMELIPCGIGKLITEIAATDLGRYAPAVEQTFSWLIDQPESESFGLARLIWRAVHRESATPAMKSLTTTLEAVIDARADGASLRERLDEALAEPFDRCESIIATVGQLLRLPVARLIILDRTFDPAPASLSGEIAGQGPEWQDPDRRPRVILPAIDEALGTYLPTTTTIRLYLSEIEQYARLIEVRREALETVVLIHEAAHAVVHLGTTADHGVFDTAAYINVDGGNRPSALHEMLAQLLTWWTVSQDVELSNVFSRLNQHQSEPYHSWREFKGCTREQIRAALLAIRDARVPATLDGLRQMLR